MAAETSKPVSIDMERNYVTVTLYIASVLTSPSRGWNLDASECMKHESYKLPHMVQN